MNETHELSTEHQPILNNEYINPELEKIVITNISKLADSLVFYFCSSV